MRRSALHYFRTGAVVTRLLLTCGLGLLALALPGKAAESTGPKYGPPGTWVKPHFIDQPAATGLLDASAAEHVLLLERQFNPAQKETFIHSVRQMLTLDGVQQGSTLTIGFNPGYQTLTWHWARIWRDAQHLDRLDTNSVKIVQQEQDLDQYQLNGQKSAVLVLDDVRVGDVVDYAYTIKGENPVLEGHFSSEVPVQLAEPVDHLLTRLVWPSRRHLFAKAHGCTVQPAVIPGKDAIEYTWDSRQVPGVVSEDLLPAWCDPEPWVQLSEFHTWSEVNQWAVALFQINTPLSPALAQKIAEWRQLPGQEQQALAALRFVQDEVRYFGIEIGVSTEKPADPSAIFARRYGDCKDKSQLFVTILHTLGIEAYPVLVNATLGRGIGDWQPSAGAFDHCIAAVVCDGQTYWLDPTMNYQRGPLAAHYLPNYGYGLVISPKTSGLAAIPQVTGLPQTAATEYFRIRGLKEPTELKVVTVAEGRDAESLRALFASTKRPVIEKSYTHFYADTYPGIKMSAPIEINDDEDQNRVQTTEYYSIDKGWTYSDKDRRYRFQFYPASINSLLKTPVDTDRRLPLGVNFPEHYILRTEVTLPQEWNLEADQKTISDPAFTFHKESRCNGVQFGMRYEYQSLADWVSPDAVGDYIQRLNQSSQSLGYTLVWR